MTRRRMTFAVVLAAIAVAAPFIVRAIVRRQSQAPVRPTTARQPGRATLGVHTLVGQEDGRADAVARTRPMLTEPRGSSFVAFSAGFASNVEAPMDNMRNTWAPLGAPVVYHGYDGAFDVRAFVVLDGRGGAGHRVEIRKPGMPAGELTMPVVEIRDAGRLVAQSQVYAAAGGRLTSGTVTTDGPAVLVAFWWGDGRGLTHDAIPDNQFTLIESFTKLPPNSAVQCAVAVREVTEAGRYDVTWTTSPVQGAALWLFAFAALSRAPDVRPAP